MPVVPGDPEVEIGTALRYEPDGVWVSHLALGSHSGTHVDAPAHLLAGGRTVDQLTLDELCGPATVLGLEGLGPDDPITAARLSAVAEADPVTGQTPPTRVLVCTGAEAGLPHPYLTEDAARWLWDAGVRLLGIDTPSPDHPAADGLPVHRVFLGGDGVLVENLTGLDTFRPLADGGPLADWAAPITLGVYPLPLAGRDGAPARVVARRPDPEERTAPC